MRQTERYYLVSRYSQISDSNKEQITGIQLCPVLLTVKSKKLAHLIFNYNAWARQSMIQVAMMADDLGLNDGAL